MWQVIKECVEAEAWLREKQQQEDSLPKYANLVLLSADVNRNVEALDRYQFTLGQELKLADVVVLTYACDRPATLDGLSTFWLPELRKLEVCVFFSIILI